MKLTLPPSDSTVLLPQGIHSAAQRRKNSIQNIFVRRAFLPLQHFVKQRICDLPAPRVAAFESVKMEFVGGIQRFVDAS